MNFIAKSGQGGNRQYSSEMQEVISTVTVYAMTINTKDGLEKTDQGRGNQGSDHKMYYSEIWKGSLREMDENS